MTGTKFQISTKLASEAVAKTTFSLQFFVINETDHGLSSYTVRVKLGSFVRNVLLLHTTK
jgi:hypothetical protein